MPVCIADNLASYAVWSDSRTTYFTTAPRSRSPVPLLTVIGSAALVLRYL
jgi:hypothetical protein